jgi:hypothetical protein
VDAVGTEFDVFRIGVASADNGVGRRKGVGFGEISGELDVKEFARGGAEVTSASAGKPSENISDCRQAAIIVRR